MSYKNKRACRSRVVFIFLAYCAVSIFFVSAQGENSIPGWLEKKIRAKSLSSSSLGLIISQIHSDNSVSLLYSLNKDRLFIPASLVKIASLSALYGYYSPSYTFKTFFLSSAPIRQGVLQGDLILKGGGDPGFTSESLWNLVNSLTRSGIKEIAGDLLVDESLYKKGPSLPYSERSYLAPEGAASFNWNSVAFHIRPGPALNTPARVSADPASPFIETRSKVKTGKRNSIRIKKKSFSKNKEIFEITGEIAMTSPELTKYRNIRSPALWLGHNTLSFLNQRGIKVAGQVKKGACSGSCKALAWQESRPLTFHTYNLMKYSNNFVARMLVSHLPLLKGEKQGDLRLGTKWLSLYLRQTEGLKNFHLEDPSGLSRKNKFSPQDLQKLLIRSRKSFYSPEMLSSYPLAGGKGTLEKRFQNRPPSSYVRAKTGSLNGVLGLAGVFQKKGEDLFSCLYLTAEREKPLRLKSFSMKSFYPYRNSLFSLYYMPSATCN